MHSETGKRPQAPSSRPLQPLKRQNDMTFGQPRKLCLLGGVLPRAIEHRPQRSTFSIFSTSVFSALWYFREKPKFRVLGRFTGALRPRPTSCSRFPVARNRPVCRVSVISGVTAILSRRPETYLRGDSTRVVVRRVKRFTPDACRAVAVPRNATDCVEARRRDLTFPQPRAIVLPPPMVWRGTLCSLRQDRADGFSFYLALDFSAILCYLIVPSVE